MTETVKIAGEDYVAVSDDSFIEAFDETPVSWAAIFGGAAAATAVSLALVLLGSGLGLATISPWSGAATSVLGYSIAGIIWLVIMQWVASGLGGYLAGRLRTTISDPHADEVFFRDTAHGFLAWAVATLITAALFSSFITSVVSGSAKAATVVAAAESVDGENDMTSPVEYYIDGLYRPTTSIRPVDPALRAETARIIIRDAKLDSFPVEDRAYLASLIAAQAGVSDEEAQRRVNVLQSDINEAKETANSARKTAATFAILTFLSLLVGAFIASVSAAIGGRHRDIEQI